jgi:tetratricopeptide (TPR) repeat protein
MQTKIFINKKHLISIVLLVFIGGAVFINTLSNDFIWDDRTLILNNRLIKELKNIPFLFVPEYWNDYFSGMAGQYRPVRTVTFAIDYAIWGQHAAGFHFSNLLFHIINIILLYFLVSKVLSIDHKKESSDHFLGIALISGLLFAAHPIHTEAVAWIKNRSELLCSIFMLSSFLAYVYNFSKRKKSFYFLSLALALISMGTKEMSLALPLIIMMFMACFEDELDLKQKIFKAAPFIITAGAYLAFRIYGLGLLSAGGSKNTLDLYRTVLTVIKTFGYYLYLLIYPFNLNSERAFNIPVTILDGYVALSIIGAGLCFYLFFKNFKTNKVFAFFLSWIFISLIPASNIIFISTRPIAEQRLYIPSVGFCVIFAMAVRSLYLKRRSAAIIFLIALIIFYSMTIFNRNKDWLNSLTFWSKAVELSPQSSRAHNNLGRAYAISKQVEKSMDSFNRAIELDKGNYDAYYNRGILRNNTGNIDEAVIDINKSLDLFPDAGAYYSLGIILERMGKVTEAEEAYRDSIKENEYYVPAYDNLGSLYFAQGNFEQAKKVFEKGILIDPEYPSIWHNYGVLFFQQNQLDKAAEAFERALELDNYYQKAYNNLGLVLFYQGDYEKAEKMLTKALVISPNNPITYSNMGAVYNQTKQYQKAIAAYKTLLSLEPKHAKAYHNLAVVYLNIGDFEKAEENALKALELGYNDSRRIIEEIGKQAEGQIKN